ncbi:TnsD family Tn7-like transposition protein [Cytobacillus praedii]|uniref:TnsD family Tn7-like transposition protein n=1 Tax=Cytobacillus praedii TaxID=1742358 RepID=UPI00070A855C|nr:TnsD family Tn7-like transposition protein [Cytobacillus praedii]
MITYFPKLYPGELLYSWFARYHLHSGNLSYKSTTNDLFEKPSYISTPDLPCSLERLYKNIQHFTPLEPKEWIKKHTFYNYYTAFASTKIRETVFNSMLYGESNNALHMLTGNMASTVKDIQYFRYCPTCVYENIKLYGEPYLHTVHQTPSSFICPVHKEILCNTSISFRGFNKHEFKALKLSNCTGIKIINNFDEKVLNLLLLVSEKSKKLIEEDLSFIPDVLLNQYKYLLNKKELITPNGNVRQKDLAEQFLNFFGEKFLQLLQSHIGTDHESCWLKTITRKHRKTFHPVRHILLIAFLGETFASINSLKEIVEDSTMQFGKGPFPCLNKAAPHYKEVIINKINVTRCNKTKFPIGTFTCNCGFVYTRRGPDRQGLNRFKIGRVKQFGDIWIEKLNQMIGVGSYSYREIGKMLNVDTQTVIKYSKIQMDINKTEETPNKNHRDYRTSWLKLRNEYPELSKTELREKNPSVYMWLYRNDRDWLNTNSPSRKETSSPIPRIDWDKKDKEIAKDVIPTTINLLTKNKPKRITISAIGKQLGNLSILERHIDKLPITKFILKDVTESTEDFQKRRIVWAVEQLKLRGDSLDSWKIKKLAGLKTKISPDLINTIEIIRKNSSRGIKIKN